MSSSAAKAKGPQLTLALSTLILKMKEFAQLRYNEHLYWRKIAFSFIDSESSRLGAFYRSWSVGAGCART
jgi:hypothetical protein